MGIALSFIPFFDLCVQRNALGGRLMVLGSQVLHDPAERIVQFAQKHGHSRLALNPDVRTLFAERFRVSDYCDCDMNGMADLNLNLSEPAPPELVGSFDAVLDAGTLEHVFDVAACYRNIHNLVKAGGAVIHISPMSWFNHAFFNFSPVTFDRIAEANGYEKIAAAFHYVPCTTFLQRTVKPEILITFTGPENGDCCDSRLQQIFRNNYTLNNVLYMVAFRKMSERPFRVPYEVSHE